MSALDNFRKEATETLALVEEAQAQGVEIGPRYPDVSVRLTGEDGNAFMIIGRVSAELKRAGYGDVVSDFREEAMSGDYDNVLATAHRWVDVS